MVALSDRTARWSSVSHYSERTSEP